MDTKNKHSIHTREAIPNPAPDDLTQFGQVVALSQNESVLAIQAQNDDGSLAAVFLYQRSDQQPWQLAFRLDSKHVAAPEKGNWKTICQADQTVSAWDGQGFGSALALSADGHTIAVGAPWAARQEDDEDTVGVVYLFRRQASSGGWKMSVLNNDDSQSNEEFGASVDLDDGILTIGAPGQSAGSIYILETGLRYDDALEVNWSGDNKNMANIPCPDAAQGRFGAAISLDGKTIAVGAPGSSKQAGGRVYIFQQTGPGSWSAQAPVSLTAADVTQLGKALALSGRALLAGGYNSAGALLFEAPGATSWSKATSKPIRLPQDPISSLGYALAASRHKLVLGSDNKGVFVAQRGAAPGSGWGPLNQQMANGGQAVCASQGFVIAGGGGQVKTAFLPTKPPRGTFTDPRPQANGKRYKTMEIGGNTWIVDNFDYDVGDGCWNYDDKPPYGEKYGRLYNWAAAKRACPPGWRLPTIEELVAFRFSDSAIFGGWRDPQGQYHGLDKFLGIWASTPQNAQGPRWFTFTDLHFIGSQDGPSCRFLDHGTEFILPAASEISKFGFSVYYVLDS